MEGATRIKQYSSRDAYLNKSPISTDESKLVKSLGESVKDSGAHKVELSKESLEQKSLKNDIKNEIKDKIKKDSISVKKAAGHLAGDALGVVSKAATSLLPKVPFVPSAPKVSVDIEKNEESKKVNQDNNNFVKNKPGIFFVSGLSLLSSSGEDGLAAMAKAVKGGEHFSWDEEDKVVEEILKRPKEQPIVLIGHSLGGDSVVRVANRLNSLEHGFRKVSLLATLDSVGFDNDIIPSNVKKNLNFISDQDYFFNDGPNIARDNKKSEVINFLRSETHREIDNQDEVQAEIISHIDEVISSFKQSQKVQKLSDLYSSLK